MFTIQHKRLFPALNLSLAPEREERVKIVDCCIEISENNNSNLLVVLLGITLYRRPKSLPNEILMQNFDNDILLAAELCTVQYYYYNNVVVGRLR